MRYVDIKKIFDNNKLLNQKIKFDGWIKFNRDSGKIIFLEVNDGTTIKNIQVVAKSDLLSNFDEIKSFNIASAIKVEGTVQNSTESNKIEILASNIKLLKSADNDYPLQNKEHSCEFLREISHLKSRSTTIQAIMRVRTELAFAIHNFFHQKGFMYMASPIITSNDCEGAGENFIIKQDENNPFFTGGIPSLTVSGQLNAEAFALGMKKVYTFGPTFRAEKSHTNRHLAEFWMVEPEINFINLRQLLSLIEQMFKNIVSKTLNKCANEIKFLNKKYNNNTFDMLTSLLTKKFVRVDYKKAILILQEAIKNGYNFDDKNIFYGKDLASEHERYLCEKHFNGPVFLFNFPKEIKAFYMKVNADGKSVAASDLLVPGVGEIVGGSQREDDYSKIVKRCQEMNIDTKNLQWYLDLRKYGYFRSSGFGLGFERILMYITGIDNIKDTIPFSRTNGELKF